MPRPIELSLHQLELLDAPAALTGLTSRINARPGLKALQTHATTLGYKKVQNGDYGLRQKFKAARAVRPPAGVTAQSVQELDFELMLSALDKQNSEDEAAIATVRISAGQNIEEYDLLLEANDGQFDDIREFKFENNQVVRARSWWTAARNCVLNRCGAVCIGALTTCTGTWLAYLGCVAAACGGCWAWCAACATCNCRWWCKWATTCCRR